ncbi:MAG: tripartite tricarboxylate transporter substrate-binding protein [Polaromonas sp.]
MQRRQFTHHALKLATIATLAPGATVALAQAFPSKPITIMVAFAAGGPADTAARAVAQQASGMLGQPVLVDNRPGAAGKIAMQALLKAPRDGYTIAYISPSIMSIAPLMDPNLGYDTVKDILPLTTSLRTSNALAVTAGLPVRNLRELVAYAKANPGKLNYGSIGNGSWYHLATEKLLLGLGIDATHIPYKGEAPAITDLVAGVIQLMLVSGSAKPFLDEGRIVAIAATGSKPAKVAPKAPLIRDSGIAGVANYDEMPWIGFGMASGTPAAIVAKLHDTLVKALQSTEVRTRLASLGDIETCTPTELQAIVRNELSTNRQLIASGRVKLN